MSVDTKKANQAYLMAQAAIAEQDGTAALGLFRQAVALARDAGVNLAPGENLNLRNGKAQDRAKNLAAHVKDTAQINGFDVTTAAAQEQAQAANKKAKGKAAQPAKDTPQAPAAPAMPGPTPGPVLGWIRHLPEVGAGVRAFADQETEMLATRERLIQRIRDLDSDLIAHRELADRTVRRDWKDHEIQTAKAAPPDPK